MTPQLKGKWVYLFLILGNVFVITYLVNDMLIGTLVLFVNLTILFSVEKYYENQNKSKGGFIK